MSSSVLSPQYASNAFARAASSFGLRAVSSFTSRLMRSLVGVMSLVPGHARHYAAQSERGSVKTPDSLKALRYDLMRSAPTPNGGGSHKFGQEHRGLGRGP